MGKVRLLSRREVDTRKAMERQQTIAEGAKLAKRVDALRETVAHEEVGLDKFRMETVTKIQSEIDTKIQERDAILEHITTLKGERKALLIPLDAKWKEVKEREEKVAAKADSTAQREVQLELDISVNVERERRNRIEQDRLANERGAAEQLRIAAERMNKSASKDLMDARAEAQKLVSNAQAIEEAALIKEKRLTLLEGALTQRQKVNDYQTKLNNEERIRVRDAYATLERIKSKLK